MQILEINSAAGEVAEPLWLARAEAVHRELRPKIPSPYVAAMAAIFRDGGRLCAAVDDEAVLGVALYRVYADTFNGKKCYVDDLVTTEGRRSSGVGHALIEHLAARARACGCVNLVLDSGTQRTQAHKFYFREGFVIPSFNFRKAL
ncbi:aminoalkylphosphonate N-acetyltransferase [Burkholderiales bacterium]|nr:MAG: GNAT family N-acetyltransferase [Burkholderiales bacterium]CAG1009722.1 aminoalkylphosphonate N-acetyltransferase [Burkholderiales bacterium]